MVDDPETESDDGSDEGTPGSAVELAYAGIGTFLKAPHRPVEALTDEEVAVLGAPYDGAVSNRPGARYGPAAIRRESGWWAYLGGYKGGLTNLQTGAEIDLSTLSIADCGDVPVFPMSHERTGEAIRRHVASVASNGTVPVVLGGDHYCTYPSFRGFAEGADHDRVGLVQIDAHSDTVVESPVFGTEFHGSSTNLIAGSDRGGYASVAQVGLRGYESPGFFVFADEVGMDVQTAREARERGIEESVRRALDAAAEGADSVYVTFDVDAVDPSAAPGTGTPVPGGLTADEALRVLETVGADERVGALDLMEVSPCYDPTGTTARLAAVLLVTALERRFAEVEG
ncbi:agmatinase family protein [Natronorarus salvus]|uniref:agmatinase family protein n=1 Tax=Natronorarus salvus TaxID=3117733 RepID=UPI002F26BB0D